MTGKVFSLLLIPVLLFGFALSAPSAAGAPAISAVAKAGNHAWLVSPLGQSPADPQNVQQAINQASPGDKIVLGAGVFDFGDFETVIIPKDLTIEGAWDKQNKSPLTTIKGGLIPLAIGRKTPVTKPDMMTVNGHDVWHVTQDIYGKLSYPFLYPPFDPATGQKDGVPYNIFDDWVAVNVNVRQITFERPYGAAIFISGMKGGTIERCRFVSAWQWQWVIEGGNPVSEAIFLDNLASRPAVAMMYGVLNPTGLYTGTDLIRGNIVIQDNVIEGDFHVVTAGDADENGHVAVVPFEGNPAPPGDDYNSYVLQDLPEVFIPFNLNPDPQPLFWVRKGYAAARVDDQPVFAGRGQAWSITAYWSEANLMILNNTMRDAVVSMLFVLNGGLGKPFNVTIARNTITTQFGPEQESAALQIIDFPVTNPFDGSVVAPEPISNIDVKNNHIDLTSFPGWTSVSISVFGDASVKDNTVKISAGAAIGFGWPTQHGAAKDNRISGTGEYAFYTLPDSNGNKFIENNVSQFTPSGLSWGPAPSARGMLLSDNNRVIGAGKVDPLDQVYDCGLNNQIKHMLTMPCPASSAEAAGSQSAQAQNKHPAQVWPTWMLKPHTPQHVK